jgi:phenylalanyl-tRNA synthetase alpha chain
MDLVFGDGPRQQFEKLLDEVQRQFGDVTLEPFREQLRTITGDFDADLAAASSPDKLQAVRDRYLGRKGGRVSAIYAGLSAAPPEAKRELGRLANELKSRVESALGERRAALETRAPVAPRVDLTLPGRVPVLGHRHPLTLLRERIEGYFARSGYEILDGPETEDDYHNFEALNMPPEHPARDMQDTLYLSEPFSRHVAPVGGDRDGGLRAAGYRLQDEDGGLRESQRPDESSRPAARSPQPEARPATLLRTHTSAMQIRYMERHEPPVRIICPGRVYRRDNLDQTHTPMFQQVEGLVVGDNVTMAGLKGTIVGFLRELFGANIEITFRPTFFPYTEPSADVFLRDPARGPKQLEVLGCGMVHPAVFEKVGYDAERYTGFAFGMGIERLAMLLYGVDDIRQFYENDVRFLEQFPQ